ncbi:MAG: M28 family peptidase [Bacteroidetes bacterium]|nr:M28 family peptidase [Bacteroidota bacterium]
MNGSPEKKRNTFFFRWIIHLFFFNPFFFFQNATAQDSLVARYCKSILPEETRSLLEVLTSDSLEGRETGKPGQKKAAEFIAGYFSSLGLKPVSHGTFFQYHPLSITANHGFNFEVNQQYFLFMKDYFYLDGYADTMIVLDTMIFVGYGISEEKYDDYSKMNVTGKPVMFFNGEPQNKKYLPGEKTKPTEWSTSWKKKLAVVYEKRPSLVFIICDSLDLVIDSLNYSLHMEEFGRLNHSPNAIPVIFITRDMARNFYPELTEEKPGESKNKIDRRGKPQSFVSKSSAFIRLVSITGQLKGQNVFGLLEGTDKKDEALVISAHYDHLGKADSVFYPGADDDGSGTSVVMELAQVFLQAQKGGHPPRRSILFLMVSGEEKGLLGSEYFVTHPPVPLKQIITDLNMDMIGRTDEKHDSLGIRDYVYIIGSDNTSKELHDISEKNNSLYPRLRLDYTYNKPGDPNRYYYRSDHYNFAKNKIPVIFYFNGTHKDYHRITDTIDKIDFEILCKRAQLIFSTAWELVNRSERVRPDFDREFEKADH